MARPTHATELNIAIISLSLFMVIFMLIPLFFTETLFIGPAPVAFGVGIVVGPKAASLLNPLEWTGVHGVTLELSRVVIAVQSFGNAIELPKRYLNKHWVSVAYIIGPVMLGGWMVTSCCIKIMVPSLDWAHCLVCASCFNAIDPVLAATILEGKFGRRIPKRLRDLLRTEGAANGLTTTVILELATSLIQPQNSPKKVVSNFFSIALAYQSILSAVTGICVGYLARRLLRRAYESDTVDRPSLLAFYLSVALFNIGLGSVIGTDEVNLCFFAGIGLDNDSWYEQKTAQTFFSSAFDLMLNLSYFVFVGTIIPWQFFNSISLQTVPWRLVIGTLCIFVLRRLPLILIFKTFIPDIKTWREALFYGHFGPIGAGSILSALLVRKNLSVDGATAQFLDQLWAIATFVVLCSAIVHGTSIALYSLTKNLTKAAVPDSDSEYDSQWVDCPPSPPFDILGSR